MSRDKELFAGAKSGDQSGIQSALHFGAHINAQDVDWYGHSALQHAVEGGHLEAAKYLMDQGANPHQKNNNGHSARDSGRILQEHAHVKRVHDFFEAQDVALLSAAYHGDIAGIAVALKYGANINAQNAQYHNHSALQHAVEGGHLEAAQYLMDQGANPHQKNNNGHSARDSGRILQGHAHVKRVHDFFEAQDVALLSAAYHGDTAGTAVALKYGANINAQNAQYHNHSALQHAVEGGHLEVAQYLMDNGANPHQKNNHGNSARDSARILQGDSHVKRVHDFFEAQDIALLSAAYHGDITGIDMALKYGANINVQNAQYHNHSALQHAVERGHFEVAKHLMKCGANLHQKNNNGHSARDSARILQNNAPAIKVIHDYFDAQDSTMTKSGEKNMPRQRSLKAFFDALMQAKTHGDSTGKVHKRMFKTNHGVNLSPQDPRTGASGLCAQASQNYLMKNSKYPYSPQDNPNGKPFEPLDGTYTWTNPGATKDNPCSAVRYTEGPKTRAWINQRDSNYSARIAREQAEKAAAEQAKIAAEVERQRQVARAAEVERQRQAERAAEAERQRQAARVAEAERQRQAALAAEQARRAAEAERQRQAAVAAEQARVAAERERQRQAEIAAEQARVAEQARIAAEAERQRQAAIAAEQARVAAEAERQRQAAVAAEQARVAAVAEQQRQVGVVVETEFQHRTAIVEAAERAGEVLIAAEHEAAILAGEEAAINLADQQNLNEIRGMFATNTLFSQRRGETDHSSTQVHSVASVASY